MASPNYPFNTAGVSQDTGEYQRLYNISINQSAYNTTNGNAAAGGVWPATWRDYGVAASKNQALDVARGGVRWKKVLQILGTYTNFKVLKIGLDSSADKDTQPTSLTFNIAFENDSHIPSSGTSVDGSTALATKEAVIKDLIADAINGTYTELVEYFDPTDQDAGAATIYRGTTNESLTISPPTNDGDILSSITVTRIGEADLMGDAEIVTDNA